MLSLRVVVRASTVWMCRHEVVRCSLFLRRHSEEVHRKYFVGCGWLRQELLAHLQHLPRDAKEACNPVSSILSPPKQQLIEAQITC